MFKIDLRSLTLVLTLGTSLLTLSHTMHGSYQAECDLLVQQNLDGGQIYAQKVAYSATLTQNNLSDPLALYAKTQLLREQNLSFNSVIATNHNALALATSPATLGLTGELIYI